MSSLITVFLAFFAVVGVPLFLIILAFAIWGFYSSEIDLMVLPIELYRLTESSVLMALPMFAFAGFLLSESKTADRLVRLSNAALGWLPGGMIIIALLTSSFFTMLTGGSGVTIVALGALLLPALTQSGYGERFSIGLITSSGSMGLLLPPAIPLLLYGVIAQQMDISGVEIKDLFIAGLLPALMMIVVIYVYGLWANRHDPLPTQPFSARELWLSVKEAKWELAVPVIVLGGIFSGLLVVSDAAAVTAIYVLIIEVFVYKEIRLRDVPKVMRDSMIMVGGILMILGVAMALTNYLVDAEIPQVLFNFIQANVTDKFTFLVLLNIFLLILGAFLDIFAAIIIMVPLILPVAVNYGIDPVHLGIVFVANMQIGYFTPPVGMNLFIASYRFNKSITTLYRATIPFMLVLLITVLIITYVPWLSLVMVR
ncbi:TRAP transporter large permease [Gynuella sunshinyii]|uniref:TRAP transporter large permease protein n=1 Tax=Gynuella sunshinyii YC6258 TaxID=1445510 RepID=A0A0C5VIT2_9GAMM|nr:TRAP transporter large permease subunit [Gynuella sunshinyii]AJQ94587.1 TRAP-type C4-dicarboxylate transport system, large permease component [Gynuella sunshinyii YC6258]